MCIPKWYIEGRKEAKRKLLVYCSIVLKVFIYVTKCIYYHSHTILGSFISFLSSSSVETVKKFSTIDGDPPPSIIIRNG